MGGRWKTGASGRICGPFREIPGAVGGGAGGGGDGGGRGRGSAMVCQPGRDLPRALRHSGDEPARESSLAFAPTLPDELHPNG